jgi:hypothetical protein
VSSSTAVKVYPRILKMHKRHSRKEREREREGECGGGKKKNCT